MMIGLPNPDKSFTCTLFAPFDDCPHDDKPGQMVPGMLGIKTEAQIDECVIPSRSLYPLPPPPWFCSAHLCPRLPMYCSAGCHPLRMLLAAAGRGLVCDMARMGFRPAFGVA